jgi:hypothetical protein
MVKRSLEHSRAIHRATPENLRKLFGNIYRIYKNHMTGTLMRTGECVVLTLDGPSFVHRPDAISEPSVDDALGGKKRGQRLPTLVDIIDLMPHHHGHDSLPRVRGLYRNVGHPCYNRGCSGYGHLDFVRVSAADDIPLVENNDGTVQVEMRSQDLWIIVEPVAMGPRLSTNPLHKLVRGYGPHL